MTDDVRVTQGSTADAIRHALLHAALTAYEDAGLSGLCAEGRWEAAVDAMRGLELSPIAASPAPTTDLTAASLGSSRRSALPPLHPRVAAASPPPRVRSRRRSRRWSRG